MRRRLLVVVFMLVALSGGAWLWYYQSSRLGDLSPSEAKLALTSEREPFSAEVWRQGDPARRGRMLADLARRHRFAGRHRDEVEALLGPADCYVGYEDEPCYLVQLEGRSFELQFSVNHSTRPGAVLGMNLR